MKLKTNDHTRLTGVALIALVLFAGSLLPARACDSCTNRMEIKVPEQTADILKALHEHDDLLAATVKEKKLHLVAPLVTTMSAYARALPGRAAIDRKVTATNALASFRTVSKELIRAAIYERQAESAAQTRKLHLALAAFDACFDYKPSPVRHNTH